MDFTVSSAAFIPFELVLILAKLSVNSFCHLLFYYKKMISAFAEDILKLGGISPSGNYRKVSAHTNAPGHTPQWHVVPLCHFFQALERCCAPTRANKAFKRLFCPPSTLLTSLLWLPFGLLVECPDFGSVTADRSRT